MEILSRRISQKLRRVAELYPAVLVTGPRQTGKTTLARHLFPEHEWILFDDLLLAEQASHDPKLFLQNNRPPFILDEVQRVPNLFLSLKAFIDKHAPPPGSIILTGSQPLPLMKLAGESLAGRVGILELLPMTPSEMFQHESRFWEFSRWVEEPPIGVEFPWSVAPFEVLQRGGLPKMGLHYYSATAEDVSQRQHDYIQTYLTKDLRDLSNVSDLGRFERFLRILGTASGRILDLSDIANQAGVPQGTAHDWYSLLQSSYVAWQSLAYSGNLGKRERKRPKNFIFDSGVLCSLLNIREPQQLEKNPLSGRIMETAAAHCLRSALFTSGTSSKPILHWNFQNKHEVDFIIELGPNQLIPIEVKLSAHPDLSDCRGLLEFHKNYRKNVSLSGVISTYEKCFWLDDEILHIPLSGL